MSSEWESCTLGDILTLQRGMDLPTQNRANGRYPVVASTGVVGFHTEGPVKGPGVVIGRSGSIGGGQFIDQDFWPLNTTLWVKDFKGNDPRYCYYLLKSIDFKSMNAESGVPTLNRNHLHPMGAIKAPLKVQKEIAGVLGRNSCPPPRCDSGGLADPATLLSTWRQQLSRFSMPGGTGL